MEPRRILSLPLSLARGLALLATSPVLSSLPKFSLDTLYMSTAKHVFEKKLKPKLLKLAQAKSSALMNKEVDRLTQTIESYLLSIVNPEWAVAIAISLTQEVPEGAEDPLVGLVVLPDSLGFWSVLSCSAGDLSVQGFVRARQVFCLSLLSFTSLDQLGTDRKVLFFARV